ncbi:hypothetical protein [Polymorphospora rubra]|uniref:hypothetical protein n=1 Tax=Polymorphospora rubra TaxID=338584 RepID=UPI003411A813
MRDPQSPAPEPIVDPGPEIARQLAFDLSEVAWAAPEKIRARARRRTQVRVLAGAVPVVVVLALVFGYVAPVGTDERPAPPAGPTPSPTPVVRVTGGIEVPQEALLQPDDVGPGLETAKLIAMPITGPTLFMQAGCPEFPSLPYRHLSYGMQVVQRPSDVPTKANHDRWIVSQSVQRLPVDVAAGAVEDVRRVATDCARYESRDRRGIRDEWTLVDTTHTWTLLGEDFVGDGSVLLEQRITADWHHPVDPILVQQFAVVRVGDMLAVIRLAIADRELAARIVTKAAERLCVTANPGC